MRESDRQIVFAINTPTNPNGSFVGHFFAARGERRSVLQVLLHGVSYDHRYWNGPTIGGRDYSYVEFMTGHGFDVLAFDLPGVGLSDQPEDGEFGMEAVAAALSAAVESLRVEGVNGWRFDTIVSVGHSLGGNVAVFTEAAHPGADALVVLGTGYYPDRPRASWKPGEREAMLAEPYTWVPAEKRLKFYHGAESDPEVVAFDNSTLRSAIPSRLWKDCIAVTGDIEISGATRVECPVYVQLGEHDPTLPGRFAEEERASYRSAASVTVDALPAIGHCFNLHINRVEGWTRIVGWLSQEAARS